MCVRTDVYICHRVQYTCISPSLLTALCHVYFIVLRFNLNRRSTVWDGRSFSSSRSYTPFEGPSESPPLYDSHKALLGGPPIQPSVSTSLLLLPCELSHLSKVRFHLSNLKWDVYSHPPIFFIKTCVLTIFFTTERFLSRQTAGHDPPLLYPGPFRHYSHTGLRRTLPSLPSR